MNDEDWFHELMTLLSLKINAVHREREKFVHRTVDFILLRKNSSFSSKYISLQRNSVCLSSELNTSNTIVEIKMQQHSL